MINLQFFPSRQIALYMARLFITRSFAVLIALVGILMMLDLLGNSGNILAYSGNGDAELWRYVGLRIPQLIARFLPFSVLLGSLIALAGLNQNSEIISMKAAGISAHQIIAPLIVAAALIAVVHFAFTERVVTRANAALAAWDAVDYGPVPAENDIRNNIAIVHGDDLIFVRLVTGEGPRTRLAGITVYDRAGGTLSRILTAESGRVAPGGGWDLERATLFDVDSGRLQRMARVDFGRDVEPNQFTLAQVDPEEQNFWRLRRSIGELSAADRATAMLEANLWHKLAGPVSTILMPLLAAVAAFGLARSGHLMVRAVIGMALGFAYFVADNFALAMGNLGAYPPFLAAWGPFLLFLLVGEAVLIRTEEEQTPVPGREGLAVGTRASAFLIRPQPMQHDTTPSPAVTRGDVARGAGLAGLSRAGALIEALAQPLYTWLFGIATYGLYVVLWGAVNLIANIVDLSMTSALQRVVPTQEREEAAHGAVKLALIVSVVPAALIALLVSLNAAAVASVFSAAPEDALRLPLAIALFAWALPLWTFVEVATSAARARRAFGPEIRLRIFWEQIARIGFAIGFFFLGFHSIGLMLAHLCSLALTAALCVPLLGRYYRLSLLLSAPVPGALARNLLASGAGLLPANLARRLLIDAPPVILNLTIPGAAGAAAAGLYEIARKLSTVPNIVRQAFQYVLGPLSSAQAHADRSQVAPLYTFASRVSTALVVPLSGFLVFAGVDILSVYRPEAMAALPLLWVLVAARGLEAIVGPASTIVEMIGHRALPLLNSTIAIALWIALMVWLIPDYGALGMAIAVAVAVVASTWAATLELQLADSLSPFDRKLFQGLAIALVGVALMAAGEWLLDGPARFALEVLLWAITSWLALRYGLTREDRLALGGLSRRLRLV